MRGQNTNGPFWQSVEFRTVFPPHITCWRGFWRLFLLTTSRTGLFKLTCQVQWERTGRGPWKTRQEGETREGSQWEMFPLVWTTGQTATSRVHVMVGCVKLHQIPLSWFVLEEWHSEIKQVIVLSGIITSGSSVTRSEPGLSGGYEIFPAYLTDRLNVWTSPLDFLSEIQMRPILTGWADICPFKWVPPRVENSQECLRSLQGLSGRLPLSIVFH